MCCENLENTVDPAGAVSGHLRINRGGSYIDFGKHLRCAYRSAVNPIDPDQNTGFRICRNAGAKDQIVSTVYDLNITLPENPKTLLVYFSYSGNTQEAAAYIGRLMNIEPVEIEMAHPYRGNIYECFLLTGFHVGMHLQGVFGKIEKKMRRVQWLYRLIQAVLTASGVFCFLKSDLWPRITLSRRLPLLTFTGEEMFGIYMAIVIGMCVLVSWIFSPDKRRKRRSPASGKDGV